MSAYRNRAHGREGVAGVVGAHIHQGHFAAAPPIFIRLEKRGHFPFPKLKCSKDAAVQVLERG